MNTKADTITLIHNNKERDEVLKTTPYNIQNKIFTEKQQIYMTSSWRTLNEINVIHTELTSIFTPP
jgi:hypothetical protein